MKVPCRVAASVGMLVAVALGAASCGDDGDVRWTVPDPEPIVGRGLPAEAQHPSAAAIDVLQRAFVERDYAQICRGITNEAAKDAGNAGHGDPTTCPRDVRRLLGMIHDGGGIRHEGKPRVVDVEASGSKAVVTVALDRRWQARVPMSKVEGSWRLSGFFGTSTVDAERAAKEIPGNDFPAAGGAPVRATRSDGSPCPPVSEDDYPEVRGGCTVKVTGKVAPLTILTVLGDFKFDECALNYRIRIDPSGRTWTDEVQVEGNPKNVTCGDVNACYDRAHETEVPWRGRLQTSPDGSFIHRTDMCMTTCVGGFVGELRVRLVPEGDAWRGLPIDGGGDSGLRFDNELAVRGDLELSAER